MTTPASSLTTAADSACAILAGRERAAAAGHPGRLLSAARRLRETVLALEQQAQQAADAVGRARALVEDAHAKERHSRAAADAAAVGGDSALAKGLRRTARRAMETRSRAEGLLEEALRREQTCAIVAEFLALRAEALESEGQEALAALCSALVGMPVRVDIKAIRAAGGAAWGPPAARTDAPAPAPSARAEAVTTEARARAQGLLEQLLAPEAPPVRPQPITPIEIAAA